MTGIEKAIKGLEWILEDDRFGFGINWDESTHVPRSEEERAGYNIQRAIEMLKEYQEAKPLIDALSDSVHDTAKIFRRDS